MMNAVILHGTEATPDANWFRWLEHELTDRGWRVWVPQLPNADTPNGQDWTDYVLANAPFPLDGNTALIGHSAGAVVTLMLAGRAAHPYRAVFAVAAFPNNDFLRWEALNSLFNIPLDYDAVTRGAGKLTFVHADNDSYCPLPDTAEMARAANGELIVLKGQQHFSAGQDARYTAFPELLNIITERISA